MKKFKFFLVFVFCTIFTLAVDAQNVDSQRFSREQMIEAQAKNIAASLALDDKVYNKFITTYVNYKKELWAIAPRRDRKHHRPSDTESDAAQKMQQRFEQSQKVLDIREKYYREFSKFMTQKQIEQMYEKEKKIMQRLRERHNRRPGKGGQRVRPVEKQK